MNFLQKHNFDIAFFSILALLALLKVAGVSGGIIILLGFVFLLPAVICMENEVLGLLPEGVFLWNPEGAQASCKLVHWALWGLMTAMFFPPIKVFSLLGVDVNKLFALEK